MFLAKQSHFSLILPAVLCQEKLQGAV